MENEIEGKIRRMKNQKRHDVRLGRLFSSFSSLEQLTLLMSSRLGKTNELEKQEMWQSLCMSLEMNKTEDQNKGRTRPSCSVNSLIEASNAYASSCSTQSFPLPFPTL